MQFAACGAVEPAADRLPGSGAPAALLGVSPVLATEVDYGLQLSEVMPAE